MASIHNVSTSGKFEEKKLIISKVMAVCVDPVLTEVPCGDHHKFSGTQLKSVGQKKKLY